MAELSAQTGPLNLQHGESDDSKRPLGFLCHMGTLLKECTLSCLTQNTEVVTLLNVWERLGAEKRIPITHWEASPQAAWNT